MTGPVLEVLPVIKSTLPQGRVGLIEGNFWMPWHLEKGTPTRPWGIRSGFCAEVNLLKLSNVKGRGDSLSQTNNQDKPHSLPPLSTGMEEIRRYHGPGCRKMSAGWGLWYRTTDLGGAA